MNGSALAFILSTKLKNWFKELVHKPGRLILTLFLVLMLGFVVFVPNLDKSETIRVYRDSSEIFAIINALFILIFSTTFITALDRGGSIFKMSDVNLLFPGPFSKRSILFFGLVQQLGTVMFVGLFILFQYSNININYGIGFGWMLLIMLSYSVVVFMAQTGAMFAYIYVSDSDEKRNRAKYIFYLLLIVLVAIAAATTILGKGVSVETVTAFGNSLALKLFPVAGWMAAFTSAMISGRYIEAALWLLLTGGCFAAVVVAMARSKREYYEDVLDSATATFNTLSATKDGIAPEQVPKNVKLGKMGIGKGVGASVLYYMHLLENRRAKIFMLSNMSLLYVVMTLGFSFFMKGSGLVPVLAFSAYCGIFTLGTGRFSKELTKPFIYLMPEPPVKKLIYALSDTFPALIVESLVTFIPAAFIVGASPLEAILCALAKTSVSILFLAGSLIIDRIWGGALNKIVGVLVYFLLDMLLVVPAVIAAAAVSGALPGDSLIMPLLTGTVACLLESLLVFFCCRNVLQYSEI